MDLMKLAEEKFGKERVLELHTDIQQLAGDIEKLHQEPLEVEDAF